MRNNLRLWFGLAFGVVGTLALTACDPYAYSVGGSYSTGYNSYGYGTGYGYGNPGFSTTYFVSTGNPRWGYDPYCHSYYDYNRRSYYDPYLYGYYPVGYRPVLVTGVPHPHGYRNNYCPPPVRITNVTLGNYHNRADAYRSSRYDWARQVRPHSTPPPPRTNYGGYPDNRQRSSRDTWSAPRSYPNTNQVYRPESRPTPQPERRPNYSQPGGSYGRSYPSQPARPSNPVGRPQATERQPTMPRNYNVPVESAMLRQRATNPQERRQQFTPAPQQVRPPSMPVPQPPTITAPQPQPQPRPVERSGGGEPRRMERPAPPAAPAAPASPRRARDVRGLGEGSE